MSLTTTEWLTIALTIISASQAYIYFIQATIMKEQNKLSSKSIDLLQQAQKTANQQLRAYVDLDGANIIREGVDGFQILSGIKKFRTNSCERSKYP